MTIYSHSQLSAYEDCPLKYKLHYRDKIERDTEGVESFLGSRVHETLQKCYEDARRCKLDSLDDLLACYDSLWDKNWHDGIVVTRKGFTRDNYRDSGRKMVSDYYARHDPFDGDVTIGTEIMARFCLDGKYQMRGYIDRLSRARDGTHCINDYKTSGHLPTQEKADGDRQLALYQIALQQMWPDMGQVRLVWHYLLFDRTIVSARSPERLDELTGKTCRLIDEIEAAEDFPPKESALCEWCEYPDLCPNRKHYCMVEELPVNKFLREPGVVIVNKFAELKDKAKEIDEELGLVREALLNYCEREKVAVVRGSGRQVKVKFDEKLKFPGKSEEGRKDLEGVITCAGKWPEVSTLDTTALTKVVEERRWEQPLIDSVTAFAHLEESCSVYLSKVKEGEE
jgi:putative RecB family exonuclease